jgi:hypothetical protein
MDKQIRMAAVGGHGIWHPPTSTHCVRLNATREELHKLTHLFRRVEAHDHGRERDGRRTHA